MEVVGEGFAEKVTLSGDLKNVRRQDLGIFGARVFQVEGTTRRLEPEDACFRKSSG